MITEMEYLVDRLHNSVQSMKHQEKYMEQYFLALSAICKMDPSEGAEMLGAARRAMHWVPADLIERCK